MKRLLLTILIALCTANVCRAQFIVTPVGGIATIDIATCGQGATGPNPSCTFKLTLTANTTLAFNNVFSGASANLFINPSTFTLTWPASVSTPPTLTASINNAVSLRFDGTTGTWVVSSGGGSGITSVASFTFSVAAGVVTSTTNTVGLTGSSGTDAAVVLNAALAQMASTGGTLYFKNGIYNMNSATQESTGGYTHFFCVGIPSSGTTTYPYFTFVGESSNFNRFAGVLGNGSDTGVIFNVTTAAEIAAGAGNVLAAFWVRPNATVLGTASWNDAVSMENISIKFPNNQRGKEIGFYMLEATYFSPKNVLVDFVTAPSAASAAGSTGIVSPGTFDDGGNWINVWVNGFETCVEIDGEHNQLSNVWAFQCTNGYYYGRNKSLVRNANISFANEWTHVNTYNCINQLLFGSNVVQGNILNINAFTVEYTTAGPWSANLAQFFNETSLLTDGTVGGTWYVETSLFGTGVVNTKVFFGKQGGHNIQIIQPSFRAAAGGIQASSTAAATTGTVKQTLITYNVAQKTLLYHGINVNQGNTVFDGGDYIEVDAWGTTAANANSKTFTIDWGGVTIATVTSTASSGVIHLQAKILVSGVTDNAQECIGYGDDGTVHTVTRTATSSDVSAGAISLVATATTPTAAGDFTFRGWTIKYVLTSH